MKEKLTLAALALLGYLLPFSAKLTLGEFPEIGIINDFTKVFLFGADILALVVSVFLIIAWRNNWSKSYGAMSALVLFLMFSWSGAAHDALGAAMLIRFIIAGLILWAMLKTPRQFLFPGLGIGLIIGGVIQSFFAVIQFIAQKSIGLTILGESPLKVGEMGVATFTAFGEKLLRAYGTLPHPNILAFYLTVALLATLIAIKIWPQSKKFLIISSLIVSLGLLLTFSRLFIVILAVLMVAGFIFFKHKFSSKYIAIALAAVIAATAVLTVRGSDESSRLRNNYEKAYSEMTQTAPWRGVGLGQSVAKSKDVIKNTFGDNYEPWMHQPVHNTYALVRTETGRLGLGLFIMFLILTDLGTMRKLKNDPPPQFIFTAAGFFLIIAAMFFEHLFITNPNSLYLTFAILGLLIKSKEA